MKQKYPTPEKLKTTTPPPHEQTPTTHTSHTITQQNQPPHPQNPTPQQNPSEGVVGQRLRVLEPRLPWGKNPGGENKCSYIDRLGYRSKKVSSGRFCPVRLKENVASRTGGAGTAHSFWLFFGVTPWSCWCADVLLAFGWVGVRSMMYVLVFPF